MKLKYLGTAAAEAVPAPFCQCPVCEAAREKGGRNIRTRSQALVDGRILLDLPADTYLHVLRDGLRLYEIDACLITHSHCDHLYPAELECLMSWAAHRKEEKTFHIYGTAPVLEIIRKQCPGEDLLEKENRLCLHEVVPFRPFEVQGYRVTALKADHGTESPVVYILEKDGTSMLYAHDTGLPQKESMDCLRAAGVCFGLVSYDCTNGLLEWDNRGHMGLTGNVILRNELEAMGRTTSRTKHIVNHFSHNGLAGYDELVPRARELGFTVSYDGMEIEF